MKKSTLATIASAATAGLLFAAATDRPPTLPDKGDVTDAQQFGRPTLEVLEKGAHAAAGATTWRREAATASMSDGSGTGL
jgi:hypothetical protein